MFKIEEHEQHINDLTQMLKIEGVDQAKVSTILQAMRENYNEVNTTIEGNTQKIQTYTELNEGLRSANMGLLSKLGTSLKDLNIDKQETKVEDKKEDVPSLDDIASEFLK